MESILSERSQRETETGLIQREHVEIRRERRTFDGNSQERSRHTNVERGRRQAVRGYTEDPKLVFRARIRVFIVRESTIVHISAAAPLLARKECQMSDVRLDAVERVSHLSAGCTFPLPSLCLLPSPS